MRNNPGSQAKNDPENPFGAAISNYWTSVQAINFERPYLPAVVNYFVHFFVITLFSIFYITIGIATQILSLLWNAAMDSFDNIKETKNSIESFSYGVAAGIFVIVSVPFAIIVAPAAFVGWIVNLFQKFLSHLSDWVYSL